MRKKSSVSTTGPKKRTTAVGVRSSFADLGQVGFDLSHAFWVEKVVFVMVGLPARGKSYISNTIVNFLCWQGFKARLFNVGKNRRAKLEDSSAASFFDSENVEAKKQRDLVALQTLEELLDWMIDEDGDVAIFDATNSTKARRDAVLNACKKRYEHVNVVFVESICTDPKVVLSNMAQKVKNSPDFAKVPFDEAMADLKKRIGFYESKYETIADEELSYMQLINLQSKVICNRVRGFLAHTVASFLMSSILADRPIYLARSGKAERVTGSQVLNEDNADAFGDLTEDGKRFAENLRKFLDKDLHPKFKLSQLVVYTSLMNRAIQMGLPFNEHIVRLPRALGCLNPLDLGFSPGRYVDELKEQLKAEMPEELERWEEDPFRYKYPGGESQYDCTQRLAPFVKELERHRSPVLVISHLSCLQVLYGYFVRCPVNEFLSLDIPHHFLIKLTPSQYGWKEERIFIGASTDSMSAGSREHKVSSKTHADSFY